MKKRKLVPRAHAIRPLRIAALKAVSELAAEVDRRAARALAAGATEEWTYLSVYLARLKKAEEGLNEPIRHSAAVH